MAGGVLTKPAGWAEAKLRLLALFALVLPLMLVNACATAPAPGGPLAGKRILIFSHSTG